ncbi:MAG TPA: hypothetical protein VF459_19855 [Caulobacteraceae bacterium]
MLPTPIVLADRIRLFFAACDADMRGRVFFADLELSPPHRIITLSPRPVLDLGAPGAFDADGVNPSQAFWHEGRLALLYVGWRRGGAEEPYALITGLAFSDDGGQSFEKQTEPLLPASAEERLFRTAACVERQDGRWRLLYIGGGAFISDEHGKRVPVYDLKELHSPNLLAWPAAGRTRLAPDRDAGEIGFGRPTPWHDQDGAATILLSVRSFAGYRLVECADGPVLGAPREVLSAPFEDWEAGMTCFGAPCAVGDRELLFYNGDGFGRTGCGLAWRPTPA